MPYQSIKPYILNFFMVSKDAIHIHIGFMCLVIMLVFSRFRLSSFKILIPGLILTFMMEGMDLWEDYQARQYLGFGASLHDVINTNFIPFILVLLAKFRRVSV